MQCHTRSAIGKFGHQPASVNLQSINKYPVCPPTHSPSLTHSGVPYGYDNKTGPGGATFALGVFEAGDSRPDITRSQRQGNGGSGRPGGSQGGKGGGGWEKGYVWQHVPMSHSLPSQVSPYFLPLFLCLGLPGLPTTPPRQHPLPFHPIDQDICKCHVFDESVSGSRVAILTEGQPLGGCRADWLAGWGLTL